MKVKIDLNKKEKCALLDIIDNQGKNTKDKRNELSFFSFSQKREIDKFLHRINEVYMTVITALEDDDLIYFPDSLAHALKSIIQAEMQNRELELSTLQCNEVNTFTKIVDQIMINPKFA